MVILVHAHESIELGFVIEPHLDQPTFAIRILVDDRWVVLKMGIDGQDSPRDRLHDLVNGGDGFDFSENLSLFDMIAHVG